MLNVLSFYEPLRQMIRNGVEAGFIKRQNEALVTFVDGPPDLADHETFDWGQAALEVIDSWRAVDIPVYYDWRKQQKLEPEGASASP